MAIDRACGFECIARWLLHGLGWSRRSRLLAVVVFPILDRWVSGKVLVERSLDRARPQMKKQSKQELAICVDHRRLLFHDQLLNFNP